jgi:hypothetical protein
VSEYASAFAWGICILLSFVGWGVLINRVLFSKEQIDWGQKAAWGLALSVCVGGVLNLAAVISRHVVLIWVIAGISIWLIEVVWRWRSLADVRLAETHRLLRKDLGLLLGSFLVCFLAILQYGGWISTQIQSGESYFVFPEETSTPVFNLHDDFQAYIVFPRKMLTIGSLGQDPFSERRLNALGGQSFLHTLVLAALPEEHLHLLEPGVAIFMILSLLLGYFAEKGTPTKRGLLVLLTFLIVPVPYLNISALATGAVLFLSLFRTLESSRLGRAGVLSRSAAVGLTSAAIVALKSSFIPTCGLMLGLSYLAFMFASRFERRAVVGAVAAMAFTLVLVLPWMTSMYQAFGTPLYPVLGSGPRFEQGSAPEDLSRNPQPPLDDGSAAEVRPAADPPSWRESLAQVGNEIATMPVLLLVLFGVAVQRFQPRESLHRHLLLAFLSSSFLGTCILTYLLRGAPIYRFSYPFLLIAILVSITDLLTVRPEIEAAPRAYARPLIAAALGVGLLVGWSWDWGKWFYQGLPDVVKTSITNSAVIPKEERARSRRMQLAVPEGQTILTILDKPFLLDFKRNTVFIADNPGTWAPAIPEFSSSEQLASYLLERSIRYTAYSYRHEAGVPKAMFGANPYYKRVFPFHKLLDDLGHTRTRIYDDGDMFVLDLSQKRE